MCKWHTLIYLHILEFKDFVMAFKSFSELLTSTSFRPVSSASVVSGRDHHELREAARRKLEPSASEHLSSAISQRTPAAGRSNRISLDSTISVGSNHRLLVGGGDMLHSPAVSSAAGGSRATSVTETTVSSHSSSGSGKDTLFSGKQ